ncbi:MAG: PQQ-binding-like beta-propeller repeat protein [Planctomycetes bacterium]|nr:PQQ-binding-like beta-propeller repeat protein [Planctomycetota bacterium]
MQHSKHFVHSGLRLAGVIALAATSFADQLFVGSSNTAVAKVEAAGGGFEIVTACGGIPQASVIDGSRLFVAGSGGHIYLIDVTIGTVVQFASVFNEVRGLSVRGNELLVAGGTHPTLHRLDKASGAALGSFTLPHTATATVLVGDRLFVGSATGLITGLDLTGGPATTLGSCTGAISAMTADATHLIVGTESGWVFRMNMTGGALDAFFTVDSDCKALAVHSGSLLIAGTNGRVLRVNRMSGMSQGSMQWNFDIATLAVARTDPGESAAFGAACPCANTDLLGGCANSTQVGAYLGGSGSASVTADDLTLSIFNLPPNSFGRLFMGTSMAPVAFGDGRLAVNGSGQGLVRFPVLNSGQDGRLDYGPGLRAFAATNFGPGSQFTAGSIRSFQAYYRDNSGPCGSGFNTTNAWRVSLTP